MNDALKFAQEVCDIVRAKINRGRDRDDKYRARWLQFIEYIELARVEIDPNGKNSYAVMNPIIAAFHTEKTDPRQVETDENFFAQAYRLAQHRRMFLSEMEKLSKTADNEKDRASWTYWYSKLADKPHLEWGIVQDVARIDSRLTSFFNQRNTTTLRDIWAKTLEETKEGSDQRPAGMIKPTQVYRGPKLRK